MKGFKMYKKNKGIAENSEGVQFLLEKRLDNTCECVLDGTVCSRILQQWEERR